MPNIECRISNVVTQMGFGIQHSLREAQSSSEAEFSIDCFAGRVPAFRIREEGFGTPGMPLDMQLVSMNPTAVFDEGNKYGPKHCIPRNQAMTLGRSFGLRRRHCRVALGKHDFKEDEGLVDSRYFDRAVQ